ncbi:MAG: FAD-dependent oxidoreductase [Peptostreptococcaceae bacterium]|jgi:NADPH-dependent 2,4-dienoyl-CoA reductase/sulfur reductase-like enzyme|nr:FAD-dependent oxidoreductase [Peptostreptococcaceae bacterium]
MKIAVIGCTHAGTAAIKNAANLYKDAKITVYERNDNISFLSCGIALYVGGVVKDPQGLFYSSPDELKSLGVNTKMQHDVLDVDLDNKIIKVENLKTGEILEDSFDKLIITTGSWPITPKIENSHLENILLCKNYDHSKEIIKRAKDINKVVVVGAGYIGVELVEAFKDNGKEVVLVDSEKRILKKYLDEEFTDIAQASFEKRGIKLALDQTVIKFEGDDKVKKVITTKGEYEADLVIMCIGFRPNTSLFEGKLDMLDNKAIIVDEYMQTSKKDVYAAGDACSVYYNPTNTRKYIPLATNAIRMGTLVGLNLKEPKYKYMGTQGTSGIKIYENNMASTGLTKEEALSLNLDIDTITIEENNRPEFMPTYEHVKLKLVYDKTSKKILGGQICSNADLTQTINTLSVCIQNNMTIEELAFIDFFFQPHYNKPWNTLNIAALGAL